MADTPPPPTPAAPRTGLFTSLFGDGGSAAAPETLDGAPPRYDHVHGPSCGHDVPSGGGGSSSSGGGGLHYHGDTPCTHTHAPELPKGKPVNGWVVAGVIATVGVVTHLINEYGKRPRKDWQSRAQQPAPDDSRRL